MRQKQTTWWVLASLFVILMVLTVLMVKPYAYRLSSIFHMDATAAAGNPMPAGFVILNAPSYDGAQYYQVARNIPKIVDPTRWSEMKTKAPGSYAYQRLLLPLLAFLLALGVPALLPWTFLLVNIGALLLTAGIILRRHPRAGLYALALCLCPAVAVALHFTLAEPLTILLITVSLLAYRRAGRITGRVLLCLSLIVLTREVNILFVGYMIGWSLLMKRWKDVGLLLLPIFIFVGWHTVIYGIFGNVPFLMSTAAHQIPGSAAFDILRGAKGYNRLTVTSIALIVMFVLPGILFATMDILKRRKVDILSLGSLVFFGVMLTMPDYIWGSITSIGRVITPVYPLTLLLLAERGGRFAALNALLMLMLGIVVAVALAFSVYPYTLTGA